MRLVTPQLEVKESDGFEKDVLQRKQFGIALSNLVIKSNDELVIALDGKWGEGKTTFIKMWQGLLNENGIPSIYIDAFKNDYTDDAFISIASAITSYADQHSSNPEKSSDFKDKAKKVGVGLLSWTAKIGVKAATLGIINGSDIDSLSEIAEDVADDTSESIGNLVKARLNAHEKEANIIQSFRDALSELPKSLDENNSGKLVIIIDELDRCKPSFAIEILEKIKHLFSVKNIAFLLVMHRQQLEEAIRSVYGRNIDAHAYLQKFINVETGIPKIINDPNNSDIDLYINKLIELHEIEDGNDKHAIRHLLSAISKNLNLSLRQLEKVFTNLAIISGTSQKNLGTLAPIIIFISVMKVVRPEIFCDLLLRKMSFSDVCNRLGFYDLENIRESDSNLFWVITCVRFFMIDESEYFATENNDPVRRCNQVFWEFNMNRANIIPMFCQRLNMFTVN